MGKTYRHNSDSFERKRKNKNRMDKFKTKSKPMKFDKNRFTGKDDEEYA